MGDWHDTTTGCDDNACVQLPNCLCLASATGSQRRAIHAIPVATTQALISESSRILPPPTPPPAFPSPISEIPAHDIRFDLSRRSSHLPTQKARVRVSSSSTRLFDRKPPSFSGQCCRPSSHPFTTSPYCTSRRGNGVRPVLLQRSITTLGQRR